MIFAIVSLFAAYLISVIHIPYPLDYFVTLLQVVFVLGMGFGIVHTFITIRSEVHGLETAREDIKNLLESTNTANDQWNIINNPLELLHLLASFVCRMFS